MLKNGRYGKTCFLSRIETTQVIIMNPSGLTCCLCCKICHTNCHTFVLQFLKAVILESWNNVVDITETQRFCGRANGWKASNGSCWYWWGSGQKIGGQRFWQGEFLLLLHILSPQNNSQCPVDSCKNNFSAHINCNYCGCMTFLTFNSNDKILTWESYHHYQLNFSYIVTGVHKALCAHLLHCEAFK